MFLYSASAMIFDKTISHSFSYKPIIFLAAAFVFFIQHWRQNGKFILFRSRNSEETAFLLPYYANDFSTALIGAIIATKEIKKEDISITVFDTRADKIKQAEYLFEKKHITEEEFNEMRRDV